MNLSDQLGALADQSGHALEPHPSQTFQVAVSQPRSRQYRRHYKLSTSGGQHISKLPDVSKIPAVESQEGEVGSQWVVVVVTIRTFASASNHGGFIDLIVKAPSTPEANPDAP
jgi:hypothetical protein